MQKPIDNKYRADFDIMIDSYADIDIRKISSLPMISIYFNPKDYPDQYVARVFDIRPGTVYATRYVMISNNLGELQRAMPNGFERMDRFPNDEHELLEVWL